MIVINGEDYLSGEEAARLLGVKRATLYAYVSRRLIRSYRQGIKRQRLYRRIDVEDLLRLGPGARGLVGDGAYARSSKGPSIARRIPLAESWIRD